MKRFFKENKLFFLLLFSYVLAILFIQPFGNFPLNDDWSYAKSVINVDVEHRINIGDWPAMTLATHVLWGYLFVKVFGFSFLVLRLSTWVSMCIGLFTFYKLNEKISNNKVIAVLASAVLLYNPIYFNMSNTFMTDVNFLTLLILAAALCYRFFEKPSGFVLFGILLLSVAITLLRQYGIGVPVAFFAATFFIKEKKLLWLAAAAGVFICTYLVFHYYEDFLKSYLSQWAAYKFSSGIKPTELEFWKKLRYGIGTRYKIILIHFFFHTFMFTAAFLPAVLKQNKWWINLLVIVPTYIVAWFLYDGFPLQAGNVFLDSGVGTDTTYETLKGTYVDGPHYFIRSMEKVLDVFKSLLIALGFSTVLLHLISKRKSGQSITNKSFVTFLLVVFSAYLGLILITDSFFDRYQLPVILVSLLAQAMLFKEYKARWLVAAPFLIVWMYISIAGTHDYFAMNNKKWALIDELIEKENVPNNKIHGTFEHVCWNQGKQASFWDFSQLRPYDYLVQYKSEDSFKLDREVVFQRYWPITKDTLRLYKRYLFAKTAGADSTGTNDTIKK